MSFLMLNRRAVGFGSLIWDSETERKKRIAREKRRELDIVMNLLALELMSVQNSKSDL